MLLIASMAVVAAVFVLMRVTFPVRTNLGCQEQSQNRKNAVQQKDPVHIAERQLRRVGFSLLNVAVRVYPIPKTT